MTPGLGRRVVVVFAAIVLIIIAHNLVILQFLTRTEIYGPFLELAGRQRFLSQRLGFLVERGRGTEDTHVGDEIVATMRRFDESLRGFEGGDATLKHPVPIEISTGIRVQRDAWAELRPGLERLLDAPGVAWPREAVTEAQRLVDELTNSSLGLVDAIETWREKLRRSVLYSVAGSSTLALLTLFAAFRLAWAKIVTPVRELRDEALRVSETGPLANHRDEIGVVSEVVTEMSESVGRLRNERQRVEQELRRVEGDYQSVFDNAVAGIFQFNASGQVMLANPALARILGYGTPTELIQSTRNIHHDLFVDPEHQSRIEALVGGEGVIKLQTQMIRRDRALIWVLESSAIVRSNAHDYCCEAVVVDITEMRKAQDGLRELSGLLLDSQERERRRIARELHDSTGQVLAALEMNLSRLQDLLGSASDALSLTGDLATQCSREIRSVSYLLHPPLLDELGLVYAVRDYADGFSKRAGVIVELDLPPGMERLSQDAESALFRVIQEALTNIHRHAESPTARIHLGLTRDAVVVHVEDEGKGIPSELIGSGNQPLSRMGVGMRGMEERLRQLGGRLTVQSNRRGTVVRGELPRSSPALATGSVTERKEEVDRYRTQGRCGRAERSGLPPMYSPPSTGTLDAKNPSQG